MFYVFPSTVLKFSQSLSPPLILTYSTFFLFFALVCFCFCPWDNVIIGSGGTSFLRPYCSKISEVGTCFSIIAVVFFASLSVRPFYAFFVPSPSFKCHSVYYRQFSQFILLLLGFDLLSSFRIFPSFLRSNFRFTSSPCRPFCTNWLSLTLPPFPSLTFPLFVSLAPSLSGAA